MPNKTLISNFKAMKDNDILTITPDQSLQFSNLAGSLLTSLSCFPNKCTLEYVVNYKSSSTITVDFCLNYTSEDMVL